MNVGPAHKIPTLYVLVSVYASGLPLVPMLA